MIILPVEIIKLYTFLFFRFFQFYVLITASDFENTNTPMKTFFTQILAYKVQDFISYERLARSLFNPRFICRGIFEWE